MKTKDEGIFPENQDFSDWNDVAKEEVVIIRGKSFLFKSPEDSDAVINALVNVDKSKSLKALCLSVVSKPANISELWDTWGIGARMGLTAAVNKFLGLDNEDFLQDKKKK